ncbi:MAG: dipeptidyl-peptidase 3 family protein [Bacteroidota bacterium]
MGSIGLLSWSTEQENSTKKEQDNFQFVLEQFSDIRILRYQVPGFDELGLNQKKLVYYLSEAARCGRDIIFDQNGKYNLAIRSILENIYKTYDGDKNEEAFKAFEVYLKRVWFSNGIHHHYSSDKFQPDFSEADFDRFISHSDATGFPSTEKHSAEEIIAMIIPVMFDPTILPKKVSQDAGKDMVKNSAVNFYQGVTEKEVLEYYKSIKDPDDDSPVSYGLNTRVVKEEGKIKEVPWKIGGLYSPALEQIVYWLEKAAGVAENNQQQAVIESLITYYQTGDLEQFDRYNILWLNDLNSQVDFINGFIETYEDPLGMKATWESVVNFKNIEATKRTQIISENAQWFEDHSPVDKRFKKEEVKGVTAKVITAAQLGGDCYPGTPIGINLPNADWIRKEHGSKSVTIENITYAYDQASLGSGFLEEFSLTQEEVELVKKYGPAMGNLHTDLHECLGHGSGQLLPGVSVEALKNYHSPLEETRADLYALYFMMDPKMIELGLVPDKDAAKAEYITYIRNGIMTQLTRIKPGNDIEQAHMRNRQLIAKWCYEKGKTDNVIEKVIKDGKTYFRINDFEALRGLFAELLAEVQRIKSEGDYEAGKRLVETYAVKVDRDLHKEVLHRYEKLNLAPYSGFINPDFSVTKEDGEIKDVQVVYKDDYAEQMLNYSKKYSFLPVFN